ncbi:unnamed protein product [Candidula unifasciata]|uniref:Anaphase-promoting complex subunit 4-like WD40 domain-containing protein n=1 Tax=Candidula unifasciata TaxID=100452 RepID=A0A8S3YG93_9EUPU|nr:unnamed protein product [Candidula unifasciata]
MARRALEADLLAKAGIVQTPLTVASAVKVVYEIHLHKTSMGVFCLQFNYTGELLAVGLGSGGIQIYDAKSGKFSSELRSCRLGGFAVMSLHFHPKEPHILYATTAEGTIHVYNIKTGQEVANISELGNEINALDFSVDGYNFVTGGKDLGVRLYDTKTNMMIKLWPGSSSRTLLTSDTAIGNTMRVFCVKFHPINQFIFVTGGWDNHLKIWDSRDSEGIKRNIRGPHICGDSIDLRETEILSGQWTALHALQEHNYNTGAVTREIMFPHTEGAFIYTAQYCNSNLVVAGGSGTNSVEVIEISTNRHVGGYRMEHPVHSVDSTNQGRLLAAGGSESLLVILQVTE